MRSEQIVGFIAEFHNTARDFQQLSTGIGQFHPPRSSDEEFDAVTLFKLLDLDCQRRLTDIENVGSSGEAAMFGHGVKGPELAENYWHNQ
jgi:hypothetical protein